MRRRDVIDAEFVVVSEGSGRPTKRRYDPLDGLGLLGRFVVIAGVTAVLIGLKFLIYPPITKAVDWLFSLGGISTGHT